MKTDFLKNNKINLVISKEVSEIMEERFILLEDIEKVVTNSILMGERFFNSEDSSYLANLRVKNVTYWVQYVENEDGIHIINVYSHRMEIVR